MIAVRRIRDLGEELGAEMPAFVNVLVDHGGIITTVAVLVATAGIVAMKLTQNHMLKDGISMFTTLILLVLFIWDMAVFWLVYVATAEGLA